MYNKELCKYKHANKNAPRPLNHWVKPNKKRGSNIF